MERGKDLAEGKKLFVIEKIAEAKLNTSVAERKNRCVMTERGKSIRIFEKILQRGNVRLHDCVGLNLF